MLQALGHGVHGVSPAAPPSCASLYLFGMAERLASSQLPMAVMNLSVGERWQKSLLRCMPVGACPLLGAACSTALRLAGPKRGVRARPGAAPA